MAHPYNPLIVSVRNLTDFLRSPDTTFKSRAIAGVTGLSIQKREHGGVTKFTITGFVTMEHSAPTLKFL